MQFSQNKNITFCNFEEFSCRNMDIEVIFYDCISKNIFISKIYVKIRKSYHVVSELNKMADLRLATLSGRGDVSFFIVSSFTTTTQHHFCSKIINQNNFSAFYFIFKVHFWGHLMVIKKTSYISLKLESLVVKILQYVETIGPHTPNPHA